jgi:hypothetical protein
MTDWINRHTRTPECRVWINTGPLRSGHNTFDVIVNGQDELNRRFSCKVAAYKYREWVVNRLHARNLFERRDAAKGLPRR